MNNYPIITNTILNLRNLGFVDNNFKFDVLSLEDRYISIKEQDGDNLTVAIIDLYNNNSIIRKPMKAEAAIMNPNKPIIALRAKLDNNYSIQVYLIYTNFSYYQFDQRIIYWKWLNNMELVIITETLVYHWMIGSNPKYMFELTGKLLDSNTKIVGYSSDITNKWCLVFGIYSNDQGVSIDGVIQLYSVDKRQQQLFEGYAGTFTQLRTNNQTLKKSNLLIFCEHKKNTHNIKLHLMDIGSLGQSNSTGTGGSSVGTGNVGTSGVTGGTDILKINCIMERNEEFPNDFPISIHVFDSNGIILILTKNGFAHFYFSNTLTHLFTVRISMYSLFVSCNKKENNKSIGALTVNRIGEVINIIIDENNLLSYLTHLTTQSLEFSVLSGQSGNTGQSGQSGTLEMRLKEVCNDIATCYGIKGSDEILIELFEKYFNNEQYKQAAQIVATLKSNKLRTYDIIQRFKNKSTETGNALSYYFSILLEVDKLNEIESIELIKPVILQNRKELIKKWLENNKLTESETLGDLIYEIDYTIAFKIYNKLHLYQKAINCLLYPITSVTVTGTPNSITTTGPTTTTSTTTTHTTTNTTNEKQIDIIINYIYKIINMVGMDGITIFINELNEKIIIINQLKFDFIINQLDNNLLIKFINNLLIPINISRDGVTITANNTTKRSSTTSPQRGPLNNANTTTTMDIDDIIDTNTNDNIKGTSFGGVVGPSTVTGTVTVENVLLCNIIEIMEKLIEMKKLKEMNEILLDYLKEDLEIHEKLQTRLLQVNIENDKRIGEEILKLDILTKFNKNYIAKLCEDNELYEYSLKYYNDITNIKRILIKGIYFLSQNIINQTLLTFNIQDSLYFLQQLHNEYVGLSGGVGDVSREFGGENEEKNRKVEEKVDRLENIIINICLILYNKINLKEITNILTNKLFYKFFKKLSKQELDEDINEIIIRYMKLCIEYNDIIELENILLYNNNFNLFDAKELIKNSQLSTTKPFIIICYRLNNIHELLLFLFNYYDTVLAQADTNTTNNLTTTTKDITSTSCTGTVGASTVTGTVKEELILKDIKILLEMNPKLLIEVIIILLELSEELINKILINITNITLLKEIIKLIEERHQLIILKPFLEMKCKEINEPILHTALMKIYITLGENPEDYLINNKYYLKEEIANYCQDIDLQLSLLIYKHNSMYEHFIKFSLKHQLYKSLYQFLLKESNIKFYQYYYSNCNDMKEIIKLCIENCNSIEISVLIKFLLSENLNEDLIILLEGLLLNQTEFTNNSNLQNLLLATTIKTYSNQLDDLNQLDYYSISDSNRLDVSTKFSDSTHRDDPTQLDGLSKLEYYLNKLNNYDVNSLAKLANDLKLHYSAFLIYNKSNKYNEAFNQLILLHTKSTEGTKVEGKGTRNEEVKEVTKSEGVEDTSTVGASTVTEKILKLMYKYSEEINNEMIWFKLGKIYLENNKLKESINCYLKSKNFTHHHEIKLKLMNNQINNQINNQNNNENDELLLFWLLETNKIKPTSELIIDLLIHLAKLRFLQHFNFLINSSVTVTGTTGTGTEVTGTKDISSTTGTVGARTVTEEKGTNSTAMECTGIIGTDPVMDLSNICIDNMKIDLNIVGNELIKLGLYMEAIQVFIKMNNYNKLAICYIEINKYNEACEAALMSKNPKILKQTFDYLIQHFGNVDNKLLNRVGIELLNYPEFLVSVVASYESMGLFDDLIELLRNTTKTVATSTELAICIAKYHPEELMEHLRNVAFESNSLNISKTARECSNLWLWREAVFLYTIDDSDKAILSMILHPECFEEQLFFRTLANVSNTEVIYKALYFYIQQYPTAVNKLLSCVKFKLDTGRVIKILRNNNCLQLAKEYFQQSDRNSQQINDTLYEIYVEEHDYESLEQDVSKYINYDYMKLCTLLEEHPLARMREIGAKILSRHNHYSRASIIYMKNNNYIKAIDCARLSKSTQLVHETINNLILKEELNYLLVALVINFHLLDLPMVLESVWLNNVNLDVIMPLIIHLQRFINYKKPNSH
uniref:Clathrin heavy chain n=1 Tax=Theileria annulata TaxID=5874 RepID=A0A3B0MZ50_THEAN